jgi:hypothetical protein
MVRHASSRPGAIRPGRSSGRKVPAWKAFQIQVAQLYRELGALNVKEDINLDGNQIDVYAEVPALDGNHLRTVISCKDYGRPVGVGDVREWEQVFRPLHNAGKVDLACIVSANGFSQDAAPQASLTGIRLMTIEQLKWAACDFAPYLRRQLEQLQAEDVFANNRYIPMRAALDGTTRPVSADVVVQRFIKRSPSPLLTILGDYGAGKTTFCKHLFITFASAYLAAPNGTRIPLYVNLRDYPGHLNLPSFLIDLLVNQYSARCPGFSTIERLSSEGRLLLLFDAFDEMASRADYQTTLNNFHALERLFKDQAKVVLTCRTHYFKDQTELLTVQRGTELYGVTKARRYDSALSIPEAE